MGREIERKFLVADDGWRADVVTSTEYEQGYLTSGTTPTVRVRRAAEAAWLTIKGASRGPERLEFEYAIPVDDARQLLSLCPGPIIRKVRHRVAHGERVWEVDVFAGENAGLVLAELELEHAADTFPRPPWVGAEVTDDHRYKNSQLAVNPYSRW